MKKGERLEYLIKQSPYKNVNQVSKQTEIPYTTIKSFIERDLERASVDNVSKLSKLLGVSVDYLIGDDETPYLTGSTSYTYIPTAISAGLPLNVEAITDAAEISIPDSLMGKYAGQKDIIILRINGDSMDKVMPDNSLIAVKKVMPESLRDGDIVVFSCNGEYSVKHYHRQGDTLIFRPNSHNAAHFDQAFSVNDEICIHGKVVMYTVNLD